MKNGPKTKSWSKTGRKVAKLQSWDRRCEGSVLRGWDRSSVVRIGPKVVLWSFGLQAASGLVLWSFGSEQFGLLGVGP